MDSIPQNETSSELDRQIALRLKRRRLDLALTLEQLAEKSGVSKAMISKIERAEVSPTAALLGRLTAGLGMTMAGLFADEGEAQPLTRRMQQALWRDPETGYTRRNLTPLRAELPVALVEVELPPGAFIDFPVRLRPKVHQLIYLLAGDLDVRIGETDMVLEPGDSLIMTIEGNHRFGNSRTIPARYIVALASANGLPLEHGGQTGNRLHDE